MKNYFCKSLSRPITLVIFFTLLISLKGDYLNAEYLLKELDLEAAIKDIQEEMPLTKSEAKLKKYAKRLKLLKSLNFFFMVGLFLVNFFTVKS